MKFTNFKSDKRVVSKPVLNTSVNTNPTKRPYNQRKRLGGVVHEKEKASGGFGLAWPQQPAAASGRNRHSTVTASAKATSNSGEGQFQTGAGHVKRTFTGSPYKAILY